MMCRPNVAMKQIRYVFMRHPVYKMDQISNLRGIHSWHVTNLVVQIENARSHQITDYAVR